MKIRELLMEGAPQALTFAVKNTLAKLREKKREEERSHIQLSIQVEIDLYKKLQDCLDDPMDAKEVWRGMSRQAKAHLPMTAHIKDYLT